MNTIVVNGRLGRDPETFSTKGGQTVCRLSVCDDKGKNNKPVWWRVSVFGKQAEYCLAYLKKGREVIVTGEADLNEYTAKDGTAKTALEITAWNVRFLAAPKEEGKETVKPAEKQTDDWMVANDIPF